MRVYIYGAGVKGKEVLELIQKKYKVNLNIKGFIDCNKTGYLEDLPIFHLNSIELNNAKVIIAIGKYEVAIDVCKALKKKLCGDIWWFYGEKLVFGRNFLEEQCISCKDWQENMLRHVEMHIMDGCNLNCRGCTHFSPLFDKNIPNYELRMNDVQKLKEKVSHIVSFYLLGGEPFLNQEIKRYIKGIREMLPDSEIYIVTNGLLIPSLDRTVLEEIQRYGIKVSVSEYKPTKMIKDEICKRLNEFKIIYEFRDWTKKQKFNKPLALKSNSKYPKLCISDGCVTIWNGKISRCPTLMYINKFNEYFGTNLPNEGIIKLDECPSGKDLINILQEEVPLCNHCIKNEIEWSVCGKNAKLTDFAE